MVGAQERTDTNGEKQERKDACDENKALQFHRLLPIQYDGKQLFRSERDSGPGAKTGYSTNQQSEPYAHLVGIQEGQE